MTAIRRFLRYGLACTFVCIAALAQAQWKLPKAHASIVEHQINSAYTVVPPFVAAANSEVQSHSPFIGISHAELSPLAVNPLASQIVDYASRFVGTRYRSGASGPKAFDCSGFTSYIFKNFGISLNRTSSSQFEQGDKVAVNNLRPGDLMFFSSRGSGRGRVGHVGMVVSVNPATGECTFIHASSKRGVVYQKFPDNGYYQKNFLGARRVIDSSAAVSPNLASN